MDERGVEGMPATIAGDDAPGLAQFEAAFAGWAMDFHAKAWKPRPKTRALETARSRISRLGPAP